jgi:hypothetical protein
MAQATQHHNRFHNLTNEMLADAIGQANAVLKGAEAECKALKDEFKQRGLLTVSRRAFHGDAVGSNLQPARRRCRQGLPRRRVAKIRDREHHDRRAH